MRAKELKQYVDALRQTDLHTIERRLASMNALREQLNEERNTFVDREFYDERHEELERRLEVLDKQYSRGQGRRSGLVAFIAVFTTMLTITFGLVINSIPTTANIQQQIQTEAPWLLDRTSVFNRINNLERNQIHSSLLLQRINELDAFFCKTRSSKLPGCGP